MLLIGRVTTKFASTNQKHNPDLGSEESTVWNFCSRFSDVISRGGVAKCQLFSEATELLFQNLSSETLEWQRKIQEGCCLFE